VKRVLVVDDEPSILLSLSHLFSNDEVIVITSSRIEDAEEALEHFPFDLVIADIRLSGIDGIEGLELLNYIRKIRPETRVILMTAYGSEVMKESALRRGAYYYYEKPIDMNNLVKKAGECGIPVVINKQRGGAGCLS
jgi:DNA-binding NtrC family response regulator